MFEDVEGELGNFYDLDHHTAFKFLIGPPSREMAFYKCSTLVFIQCQLEAIFLNLT